MTKAAESQAHVPVFLETVLDMYRGGTSAVVHAFDGTFGRGGHARAVMQAWPEAHMTAFDWDEDAIRFGQDSFKKELADGRMKIVRSSYQDFKTTLANDSSLPRKYDRMLLDLGVSSPQLDQAERGFSFNKDGPLDMRMDQRLETTAADLVNNLEEQELAKVFIEYGEVQRPFRVVRAICHDRVHKKPYETTRELSSLIERVDGWHKKGQHPATRYFMALRLKVNEELEGLTRALPDLIEALTEGGVLVVITFHSLEDRIVKNIFKSHLHVGRLVNKKVIQPDDAEIARNPRSRSAKLRAFEKGHLE